MKINFHIMSVPLREGKKQLLLFTKEFNINQLPFLEDNNSQISFALEGGLM